MNARTSSAPVVAAVMIAAGALAACGKSRTSIDSGRPERDSGVTGARDGGVSGAEGSRAGAGAAAGQDAGSGEGGRGTAGQSSAGTTAHPMDGGTPLEGMLRDTIPGDAGPAECPGPTPWTCELPRTDLSGIGDLSVSDLPRPQCPEELPTAGDPCTVARLVCGYGNRARSDCRAVFTCMQGRWQARSLPPCLAAPDGFCPQSPPPVGEPCEVSRFANYGSVPICEYGTTIACYCAGNRLRDPHVWGCNVPPTDEGCPEVLPNAGEGCDRQGLECTYGGPCQPGGGRWFCRNGVWEGVDDSGICSEG